MFDTYSSPRVEFFSIFLLDQILAKFDLGDISSENKRIIVNELKLKDIPDRIEECLKQRHQGQYGVLDKDFQGKLNIKLLCYDLLGRSGSDKHELIKKFVSVYDSNKKARNGFTFEDTILDNLHYDLTAISSNLKSFLDRVGILYNFQKNKLRRRIVDEEQYKKASKELDAMFNKHIDRAFKLFH